MKNAYLKLSLTALFTGAVTVACAANPFADVSSGDWSYQAVEKLSEEGVVEGYPDGTFKGQQHITRYEMAQITARLMAKEDQMTAEQKASVDQLASAYSDELRQLGVRVTALEAKMGNLKFIEEARFHYMDRYDNIHQNSSNNGEFGARVRLTALADVNSKTKIISQFQMLTGLGGTPLTDINGNADSSVSMNNLFAWHEFTPKIGLAIGQFPVKMGVTGYTYDGAFKGLSMILGDRKKGGHLQLAYGRAVDINTEYTGPMEHGFNIHLPNGQVAEHVDPLHLNLGADQDNDVPAVYASYIYINPLKFEGHLYKLRAIGPVNKIVDAYGTALSWYPWKFLNLHGEYVKNNRMLPLNNEKPYSYNCGISYGIAHPLYPKSMLIGIDYVYSEAGTYFGSSSSDVADQYMGAVYKNTTIPMGSYGPYPLTYSGNIPAYMADKLEHPGEKAGGAKFFLGKVQYVPARDVLLEADYGFHARDMAGRKLEDIFRIQATFYFGI